jgi:hypothetical protein
MKRISITAALLSAIALSAAPARADAVSDRVLLIPGGGSCATNTPMFRRIKQLPDGSQTTETVEFQVPSGTYLEITSVEYTLPYYTPWAKFYVQSLDVTIRQRGGTASTSVLSARYGNSSVFADDGTSNYADIGELVSSGAQSHTAAFPVGPLMSAGGRLCAASSANFWMYGGTVRIRGRLIPSGEVGVMPSPGTLSP